MVPQLVTRTPIIQEGQGKALLMFDEVLKEGYGPYGGRIQMEIELLRGVQSVDDALKHFTLENGCAEILSKPNVITKEAFQVGLVVTIDFVKACYAPGNTWSYVLTNPVIASEVLVEDKLKQYTARLGTLYIHPTFCHKFDWHQSGIKLNSYRFSRQACDGKED
jgi:hypothetical protein